MFEDAFKSALLDFTNKEIVEQLWLEIKSLYSARGRHYHVLSHLDHLIHELSQVKDNITDWQLLVFSIAYHDIVYNPLKSNNEEKSAGFCIERLSLLKFSDAQRNKCFSQIIATKAHSQSDDKDTNYLVDADLAILGSAPSEYRDYKVRIRKEYKMFPDLIYKPGRKKVLHSFLSKQHIYHTEEFRHKFEQQAVENINDELKELSS